MTFNVLFEKLRLDGGLTQVVGGNNFISQYIKHSHIQVILSSCRPCDHHEFTVEQPGASCLCGGQYDWFRAQAL